jgi:hypothetical protein
MVAGSVVAACGLDPDPGSGDSGVSGGTEIMLNLLSNLISTLQV